MNGQLLVWDATCPDTFTPSYVSNATREAGAVAALAEERKRMKYSQLDSSHQFEPVAIETTGVIGERSRKFLEELGRRIRRVTGEVNSTAFLLQRLYISIVVQRGNAASVLGTIGSTEVM